MKNINTRINVFKTVALDHHFCVCVDCLGCEVSLVHVLRLCLQVGSSARFPPVRQSVQSVGCSSVFVQECGGVSAAASVSRRLTRWAVCVLLHRP